ncbi:iron-sulfur cluster-binding protein [Thioalkalivibrio sp. HK1]|uniref:iron-sulfur cluster-binding protein n=1 Tax=Thioalkalivibrio sp. HK1 TaxID=1469245 RepID=UPI0004BB3615|nr:hypothetical protein [Thioalkalivibrio sp. HK1]
MSAKIDRQHRDSIAVEDCEIIANEAWPGNQWRLRLRSSTIAARALPGSFVHLRCDPELPMRRPMSLMRAEAGVIEMLYKEVGHGTRLLAGKKPGENLNLIGPIGRGFTPVPERPFNLLIGGGVGIPPIFFFAHHLQRNPPPGSDADSILVLLGSELPFPFATRPAQTPVPGAVQDPTLIDGAAMRDLDEKAIASRLASRSGFEGCHFGHVGDLARLWLDGLDRTWRDRVAIHACGPLAMLEACVALAHQYDLPCRISLEESMACAVGGCAGCTVRIRKGTGVTMQRVCVDGPVFDGRCVVFQSELRNEDASPTNSSPLVDKTL